MHSAAHVPMSVSSKYGRSGVVKNWVMVPGLLMPSDSIAVVAARARRDCARTPHDIDCAITNQLCSYGACVDAWVAMEPPRNFATTILGDNAATEPDSDDPSQP